MTGEDEIANHEEDVPEDEGAVEVSKYRIFRT